MLCEHQYADASGRNRGGSEDVSQSLDPKFRISRHEYTGVATPGGFHEGKHTMNHLSFSGRIIMHIGPHKTGTTSIQEFLSENYDKLLDLGVLYPKSGRSEVLLHADHSVKFGNVQNLHHPFVKDVLHEKQEHINQHIRALETEIAETRPCLIVLSSEVLGRPDVTTKVYQDLTHIFKYAARSYLLYLRRQDDLMVSVFCEQIKSGALAFPESIDSPNVTAHLDHRRRIAWLKKTIRGDTLIVRSYEHSKRNLIGEFVKMLGIEMDSELTSFHRSNTSPNRRLIVFMWLSNTFPSPINRWLIRCGRITDETLERLGFPGKSAKRLLNESKRRAVMDNYATDNRLLDEEFFPGTGSGLVD